MKISLKKIMVITTVIIILVTALAGKMTFNKMKNVERFESDVRRLNEDYEKHLSINVDLKFVSHYKIGHTGYAFVLDQEGVILIHPHEDTIGLQIKEAFESFSASYNAFVYEKVDGICISEAYGKTYMTFYYRATDGSILVSTAAVKGNY